MKNQNSQNMLRQLLAAAALVIIVGGVLAYYFVDWGYGEVSSQGYEYSKALVSICNQKDEARLEELSKMLEKAGEQKQLGANELRWIQGIVAQGRSRNWIAAERNARRLLKDQVKR